MTLMKSLLALEEAALLLLALFAVYLQPISIAWWIWPFVFLSPDLGMLGYLISPRAGAWSYNFLHHKGTAAACVTAGLVLQIPVLYFTGLVLAAHACFDRMLGYGLKHEESFNHTHLGRVGKGSESGHNAGN